MGQSYDSLRQRRRTPFDLRLSRLVSVCRDGA